MRDITDFLYRPVFYLSMAACVFSTALVACGENAPSPAPAAEATEALQATSVVTPAGTIVDATAATPLTPQPKAAEAGPYLVAAGRSPIPAEGERLTDPIPAERLIPAEPAPAYQAGEIIPWPRAKLYVDRTITTEGYVVRTYNYKGRICFLNFTRERAPHFYVPVFKSAMNQLKGGEDAAQVYLEKIVQVTGEVELYKGKPCIEVRDLSQIKIVEKASVAP